MRLAKRWGGLIDRPEGGPYLVAVAIVIDVA
jgi:hypothetical protein